MLNSKNYILFTIPYLTICCSIYHLCYWGQFGLNGLSLIAISDIIKSAVYPFFWTIVGSLGSFWGERIVNGFSFKNPTNVEITDEKLSEKGMKVAVLFAVLVLIVSLTLFLTYKFLPDLLWLSPTFIFVNILMQFINVDKIISSEFSLIINRRLLLFLIIYLPCFCISTSVQDAMDIIHNRRFQYTVRNVRNINDTLKFVGITEKNFVFVSLNNDNLYFEKLDTMTLYFNK